MEDDIEVIGEASDGIEAIDIVKDKNLMFFYLI